MEVSNNNWEKMAPALLSLYENEHNYKNGYEDDYEHKILQKNRYLATLLMTPYKALKQEERCLHGNFFARWDE